MACNAHTVPLTTPEGDTISLRALVLKHVFRPLNEMLHPEVDVAWEERARESVSFLIDSMRALSAAECEANAAAQYENDVQTFAELNASHEATIQRFERAKTMLEAWVVQPVLAEFKESLLKELADDWPGPKEPYAARRRTGEEWRAERIASHAKLAGYYVERIEQAHAVAEKNRQWAEALVMSLPEETST